MAHWRFWTIEGQSVQDGTWHPVYQYTDQQEARRVLAWCFDQEDDYHERFEDFKLVAPTGETPNMRRWTHMDESWFKSLYGLHTPPAPRAAPAATGSVARTRSTRSRRTAQSHKRKVKA